MDSVNLFRIVALSEATSFIALLIATAVKHGVGPEIGVQILGPLHGALFLAYLVGVVLVRPILNWNLLTSGLVALGAVVPFGGYGVDYWMRRNSSRHNAA